MTCILWYHLLAVDDTVVNETQNPFQVLGGFSGRSLNHLRQLLLHVVEGSRGGEGGDGEEGEGGW